MADDRKHQHSFFTSIQKLHSDLVQSEKEKRFEFGGF
jgi:hypothetical protein